MSSEPEKDIEKQIRSYADKRREAAGERFTLHPADRQVLQTEVAEVYPRNKAEPTPITVLQANEMVAFWTLFRRQLAVFGSFAVVLLAVGIIWVNYGGSQKTDLAKADATATAPDMGERGSEPLEMVDLGGRPELGLSVAAPSSPSLPPTVAAKMPEPAPVASAVAGAGAASEEAATLPALAMTPVVAAVAPEPLSQAMTPDPSRLAQRFVAVSSGRTLRRNFNSPPPVEILKSFQAQQVGRQLLLVDADGSTYAGEIVAPEGDDGPLKFRVRGASRTLNLEVAIEGSLLLVGPGVSPGRSSANLRVSNDATLPLNRLRIQGRATVGADSHIPISALPSE